MPAVRDLPRVALRTGLPVRGRAAAAAAALAATAPVAAAHATAATAATAAGASTIVAPPAAFTAVAPPDAVGAAAPRCVAGGVPLATGPQALLVRRAAGSRTELWACRRGSRRALRLGLVFRTRTGAGTGGGARSAVVAAAVGGTVAAAAFLEGASGCIYEYGCAGAPRPVLRIADVARATVRRLPLTGALTALTVGPDGTVTYRVDELLRVSTYRTAAAPGAPVGLVGREPVRGGPG